MTTPIIVIVRPAGNGRYFAMVGETELPPKSDPLCNAARLLLPTTNPATPLIMRYAGSDTDALISTVGEAAKLTVQEGEESGPRFIRWKPFPGMRSLGFSEKNEGALVGVAGRGEKLPSRDPPCA